MDPQVRMLAAEIVIHNVRMGVLMKALRPLTIITLGPSVLGLVVAAVAWIAVPSERSVPDVASALLIGAVGGVFVFSSIAAFRLLTERCLEIGL